MSYKNTLIVGMAVIGALALLTGTFVTIPTVLAYSDPNERDQLEIRVSEYMEILTKGCSCVKVVLLRL